MGQLAFYDVVNGGAPRWVGYVHGTRVTGRCSTAELASELVAIRSTSPGPTTPGAPAKDPTKTQQTIR